MDAKQVNDQKATADTIAKDKTVAREREMERIEKMLKNKEVQKFIKKSFLPAMKRLANE